VPSKTTCQARGGCEAREQNTSGSQTRTLILCPLAREWSFLVSTFAPSIHVERLHDLKVEAVYIPDWRALVAPGGHGKSQFAVQAQYLIGRFPSTELVICAGAAGSLSSQLSVGDVVVGTETVQHDHRLLFASRPLSRFSGHGPSIDALRRPAHRVSGFQFALDVIASGDEDVVTSERAQAIRDQTGAACVAWEGSGAARAALFNGIGSLEIRAVTDPPTRKHPNGSTLTSQSLWQISRACCDCGWGKAATTPRPIDGTRSEPPPIHWKTFRRADSG
jgi:adenosylhomocysteine nucleosidase